MAGPPSLDVGKFQKLTENKITDEEILKILEQPTSKAALKNMKKKKEGGA